VRYVRYLMTFMEAGTYCSWLTPMTNMGASGDGAETTTFLAPPCKCALALSTLVKQPVDSTTYSAPSAPHGISFGSRLQHSTRGFQLYVDITARIIYTALHISQLQLSHISFSSSLSF